MRFFRGSLLPVAIVLISTVSLWGQKTVTCSSDDGKRHFCRANTQKGVQLTRQRSGSACQQDYSWGWDGGGIWVDHGCRADFVLAGNDADRGTINNPGYGVGGYGAGGYSGGNSGREKVITCSDDSGHGNHCTAMIAGGVDMVHQRSESACTKGYSWGVDNSGVWVEHGCRADFVLHGVAAEDGGTDIRNVVPNDPNRGSINNSGYGVSGYNANGGGGVSEKVITCSDDSGHGSHCNAIVAGGVDLVRQRSGSACTRDYSWGVDNSGVWVSHGCRADFVLHGVAR